MDKTVLPFCENIFYGTIFSVELGEIMLALGVTVVAVLTTMGVLVFYAR